MQFSGSPWAWTLYLHSQGRKFIPDGEIRSRKLHNVAQKKKLAANNRVVKCRLTDQGKCKEFPLSNSHPSDYKIISCHLYYSSFMIFQKINIFQL